MLTNKSFKQYSYISRYSIFPYYYNTEDEKYIYGLTAYLDDTTPYTLHVAQKTDTFDNLALKYYGNPTMYWVICSYNHIQNPFTTIHEGQHIKIPSISSIKFDRKGRS